MEPLFDVHFVYVSCGEGDWEKKEMEMPHCGKMTSIVTKTFRASPW